MMAPDGGAIGPDDAEIVDLLKKGEQRGVELLLQKYGPKLTEWVVRKFQSGPSGCGVRDVAEAQSLVIDAAYRAFMKAASFKAGEPLLPWFRTVVGNATLDELRKASRRREHERTMSEQAWLTLGVYVEACDGGEPSPDVLLDTEYLRIAITMLGPKSRALVEAQLMYDFKLTAHDLAAFINSTPNAVYVLQRKAYRTLEKHIKRLRGDDQ